MKINTRLGVIASFAFILTGLIILVATSITGEKAKEGWLLFSLGLFLGVALIIKKVVLPLVMKEKKTPFSGKRRWTGPHSRAPAIPELCAQGKKLKMAARAGKGIGPYTPAWDTHRQSCPICRQAEEH